MATGLDRLLTAGFRRAGYWVIESDALRLVLDSPITPIQNVVYAFTVNSMLTYVGKTTQGLPKRMQGYRSPAATAERGGSTNIKNNNNIVTALASGAAVEIYVLDQTAAYHHGEFPLNVAAGIEDSLIRVLNPPWNGRGSGVLTRSPKRAALARSDTPPRSGLGITLHGVPSAAQLFAFCRARQGSIFSTTARGSEFSVEVVGTALEITPASSGQPRSVPISNVSAVLARLAHTGSPRNMDYKDLTFNSSYVLAVAQAWRMESAANMTDRQNQGALGRLTCAPLSEEQ